MRVDSKEDRSPVLTEEMNKVMVRRFLEAHAEGDLDTLEEMLAPDFVDHNLMPSQQPGREGYLRSFTEFHAALAQLQSELGVEDIHLRGFGLPRISLLLRPWVNEGKKKGRSPVEVGTSAKTHLGELHPLAVISHYVIAVYCCEIPASSTTDHVACGRTVEGRGDDEVVTVPAVKDVHSGVAAVVQ
jgi:hypothetical protein